MSYQDPASFRQALEQRLKDRANGDGVRVARMRKRVAFDCLLARLSAVAPKQWLLKGGYALDLRLSAKARSTKDVDIEWRAEEEELLEVLLDASAHDPGDFFNLTIESTGSPGDHMGGSHRFRVNASLAGRPFESFVLDVGCRESQEIRSETLRTDDLLAFAGIEPVEVDAVLIEAQVAEKLHALTRTYEGGRTSTRTKDLVDIVLISSLSGLDAKALEREIHTVFAARDTHSIPEEISPPPPEWSEPFRRLADEVGIPNSLTQGHMAAAAMLDPILSKKVTAGTWSPESRRWGNLVRRGEL